MFLLVYDYWLSPAGCAKFDCRFGHWEPAEVHVFDPHLRQKMLQKGDINKFKRNMSRCRYVNEVNMEIWIFAS